MAEVWVTRGDAVWRVFSCRQGVFEIVERFRYISHREKRGKLGMVREENKLTTSVTFV